MRDEQFEIVSVRNKSINYMAGGHRGRLSKLVDADDPAIEKMLDILCHQIAIYQDAKAEINQGVIINGKTGTKVNPAISVADKAATQIRHYMERLGLVVEPEDKAHEYGKLELD